MTAESDIISMLENPAELDTYEEKQIMRNAETHYMAALNADNADLKAYELEMCVNELERYKKERNIIKS